MSDLQIHRACIVPRSSDAHIMPNLVRKGIEMKLWLLRPIKGADEAWEPWYDKAFGFVIRAKNEETARKLAHEDAGDENHEFGTSKRNPWLDDSQSSCVALSNKGSQEVVIKDFALA